MTSRTRIVTPLLPALVLAVVAAIVWNIDAGLAQYSTPHSSVSISSHVVAQASVAVAGVAVGVAVLVSASRLITWIAIRRGRA